MAGKDWEVDDKSIMDFSTLTLLVDLQASPMVGATVLYERYLRAMDCTEIHPSEWMDKEDFAIRMTCIGLGWHDVKFSDIINTAIVKGGLEVSKALKVMEKQFNIEKG